MKPAQYDVCVGVFGQNEGRRLSECLHSISNALGTRNAVIVLILNGSTDDSLAVARATAGLLRHPLRIYTIPHADKANAINQFFYNVRENAALYVCVDAYAVINPAAIDAITARFRECPDALVTTGIAGNGRTEPRNNEKTLVQGGVIHGQLYALTRPFLDRLVHAGIRLPVGLYRGDSYIGALACHDLDAVGQPWNNARLAGVAGAVFRIERLSPLRLQDVARQFRRKVRQMRGRIENAAIRQIVHAHGFAALPRYADDMIRDYLETNGQPNTSLFDRPFMLLALRQHGAAVRPAPTSLVPVREEVPDCNCPGLSNQVLAA